MPFFGDDAVFEPGVRRAEHPQRHVATDQQPSRQHSEVQSPGAPLKEIRTVMRDGNTFREEYEQLNPDGTVTKTIRTGDREGGVKNVEVYKMDKSGIVRRVEALEPKTESTQDKNQIQCQNHDETLSNDHVVPQVNTEQMEHVLQLREQLGKLEPSQRVAVLEDYKQHLLDYGTKKLQKNLSKKFEKVYELTDEQVQQLINHGVQKLRHVLSKSIDEEFIPLVTDISEKQPPPQRIDDSKSKTCTSGPVSFRIKPDELSERNTDNSSNVQRPVSFVIRPENVLRRYSKPISSPEQKNKDNLERHSAKNRVLDDEYKSKHYPCEDDSRSDSDKLSRNVSKLERNLKNYLKEDNTKDRSAPRKSDKEDFSSLEDAYKNIKKLMKLAREKEAYEEWREMEEEFESEEQGRKDRIRYEKEKMKQERERLKELESYSDSENPLIKSLNKFIKNDDKGRQIKDQYNSYNGYPIKENIANSKQQHECCHDFDSTDISNRQQKRLYTPLTNDESYQAKQNDQHTTQDSKQFYTTNTKKEPQEEVPPNKEEKTLPQWIMNVINAFVKKNDDVKQHVQPEPKITTPKTITKEEEDVKELDFSTLISNIWKNTMNTKGQTQNPSLETNERTPEPQIATNSNSKPTPEQGNEHKSMDKDAILSRIQRAMGNETSSKTGSTYEIPRERNTVYQTQPEYRIDRISKPSVTNQTARPNTNDQQNTNNDKSPSFNIHPKTYSQESQQQPLNNPKLHVEHINLPEEEMTTPWWFDSLSKPPMNEGFVPHDNFTKPMIKPTAGELPLNIESFFSKPNIQVQNFPAPMIG